MKSEALSASHSSSLQASIKTSFLGGTRHLESRLGSGMLSVCPIPDVAWEIEGEELSSPSQDGGRSNHADQTVVLA
jgi:hypothetical protein